MSAVWVILHKWDFVFVVGLYQLQSPLMGFPPIFNMPRSNKDSTRSFRVILDKFGCLEPLAITKPNLGLLSGPGNLCDSRELARLDVEFVDLGEVGVPERGDDLEVEAVGFDCYCSIAQAISRKLHLVWRLGFFGGRHSRKTKSNAKDGFRGARLDI